MALEVVGGAFLSGFFEAVFDKMSSLEVGDFIRGKNLEGGLRELRTALLSANALVDDAEEKQLSNDFVKQWVFDLKEAVYDAEDLVAEIKAEALRRKLQEADQHDDLPGCTHKITSKAQQLIYACFHPFDKSLYPKLNDITGRLDSLAKQKTHLNLKEGAKHARLSTTSLVDDSGVYGRDEDKETLIQLLRTDNATPDKIGVISIVGMGGLGKTTLAQLLYNDDRVKRHFDFHAWVCVSEEFNIFRITQTIYKSVTSQSYNGTDLNELQISLKEALTRKKFFFVLDDVWGENCDLFSCWETLRLPFENGASGSKIIVTTRDEDVASKMGTCSTHHLDKISAEHSWQLFAKYAFNNTSGSAHPKLVEIGRQIVKKCNGLPLAAKSLGGLLRSKLDVKEWEEVLKSEVWGLPDRKNDILPALLLSYHYLPLHLKRCFAYCSIFPKDFEIKKSKLILLWMAEDLLQPTNEKMIEEVGGYYFNDLTSRSFFQHSSRDDYFTMHDLINDVAKFVSEKFCIRLEGKGSLNIGSKTRHFSFVKRNFRDFEKFVGLYEAKHLRTFLPLSNDGFKYTVGNVNFELLLKLQCLRVLNLSEYDIKELPNWISKLKLLRHLDLSWTSIEKLPDTLCSLYNLQVLLLNGCRALTQLPTNMGRLINLRHLDIRYTMIEKMPPHLDKLKDLQTLRGEFVLDKRGGYNIVELKELQYLRGELFISSLHNLVSVEDALETNLREKKYLKELVLEWGDDIDDAQRDREREVQVLHNLQPHTNLEALEIYSYGGTRFPSWLGDESFSNLVSVRLQRCGYCLSLPSLGQLPSLAELTIVGLKEVESIGPEFYGAGFPNLCELFLDDCPKLSGRFLLDYFPKLEKLTIGETNVESLATSQCPKLLLSLSELWITDCPNFVCFPDGGLQAPNLTKIHISDCEKLRSLPEEMHTLLPSLQSMYISDCPQLESFPEGGLPAKLQSLDIYSCKKVIAKRTQWGLQRLTSLQHLGVGFKGCEEVDSFPEEGLLPTTLTSLKISACLNLKTLNGKELTHLTSLESLLIWNCPELHCLPDEGLPPSLSVLRVSDCPLLKQRCQREAGEDWPKIAHIPNIYIQPPTNMMYDVLMGPT